MKQIFNFFVIGFGLILLTTGCNCNNETVISTVENPDRVCELEYKGHRYIMFEDFSTFSRGDITGIVHDPDCPCHNK